MPLPFIGRHSELSVLENEYLGKSSLVVVSGRKGMGKTRLIREFAEGKNALYFLIPPVNEHTLVSEFNKAVNRFHRQNSPSDSLRGAMERFASLTDNKKVLIMDGFHNTSAFGKAFLDEVRTIWDEVLSERNVMLVLVSSVISYTSAFSTDTDSPLYGAVSREILLEPLPFEETRDSRGYAESVKLYSIHGGVPYCMSAMGENPALDRATEMCIDPDSPLFDLALRALETEVKGPSVYLSVMKAIADGSTRITQISEAVGMPSTTLNAYLKKLLDNGVIERSVPATEYLPERSKSGNYSISDAHTLFWLRFVLPHISELSLGDDKGFRGDLENNMLAHCQEVFAGICRSMIQPMAGEIGFLPVLFGRYWNRETDIDVVALNPAKRRVLVAGCPFLDGRKVNRDDVNALLHRAEKVPEFRGYIVRLGMFSVTGFEEDLLAEPNLLLVDDGTVQGRR